MMAEPIDWVALAKRISDAHVKMTHHEETGLYGWEFEAEALRRAFGYSANDGADGQRELPYETVHFPGLITVGEHEHLRNAHTVLDRMSREAAEKRAAEDRAELRRVRLEAQQDVADAIRERCNERSVPSRYRREGVELAADWIDPRVPKDRFGDPLPREKPADTPPPNDYEWRDGQAALVETLQTGGDRL